jgi:GT2 family glycosyltransferase
MYAEDIELCWWLARRGWRRRLETDISVPHVENASGSQAWGEDYEERCFDAIYDWYQRDVGAVSLRVMAALNALTAGSRAIVGQVVRRPAEHVANRTRAARYHTRVAVHGPVLPSFTRHQ